MAAAQHRAVPWENQGIVGRSWVARDRIETGTLPSLRRPGPDRDGGVSPFYRSASYDGQPVSDSSSTPSTYRGTAGGNTGIDYATTFESDAPGPHVMLSALVHGNELCGAHCPRLPAARRRRPERGRLTLAFMKRRGVCPVQPCQPRCVALRGGGLQPPLVRRSAGRSPATASRLRRAREVRPLVDTADLLLDVHSMPARDGAG